MNHYVIDASAVIQHFITDTHTAHVNALFDELGDTVDLHLPEFGLLECANVIWKRARFHGMPQSTAEILVDNLIALPLTIVLTSGVLGLGLQIGLRHNLAVYDSLYVALAVRDNYPLITADIRQENAAKLEGVIIKTILDFKP